MATFSYALGDIMKSATSKNLLVSFFLVLSIGGTAFADAGASYSGPPHEWTGEIDLVQPFVPTVHIVKPKLTRTLWGTPTGLRGDLVLLAYLRPDIAHDVVESISEYMVGIGYRQYLWRGLHAEGLIDGGVAWGKNRVDGMDYTTTSLFGEVNVGYRFGFFEPGGFFHHRGQSVGLFVAPQIGTIFSLGFADIGPRDGEPDWFVQGNLLVGVSF